MRTLAAWLLGLGLVSGCSSAPRGVAKAQEQAHDFNLHARFGRLELAAESVAPALRDQLMATRREWGGDLRVVDMELAGVRPQDRENQMVDVLVRFSWYRVQEGSLKVTTLKQRWRDHHGNYSLVAEERVDGDVGLIGEPVTAQAPSRAEAPAAHFPTVRLRGAVSED